MNDLITAYKSEKNYDKITEAAAEMSAAECGCAETAHVIGKAYEKKNAFSQALPWYIREYELMPADEVLGTVTGIYLALGRYNEAQAFLDKAVTEHDGYYFCAALCELAMRTGAPAEQQTEYIEQFLDVQYEEGYMLHLASLYISQGREKEASRICKKVIRLFINGESADYAEKLLEEIKNGNGAEYVKKNPWKKNSVFKHLSFDPEAAPVRDIPVVCEKKAPTPAVKSDEIPPVSTAAPADAKKPAAANRANKISPIVEKSMENIVGMNTLRTMMNNILNMLQTEKKRGSFESIFRNNLIILGPDGSGKTTAAYAACRTLKSIGIISKDEPVVADYDSLLGETPEETHTNVENLFTQAENGCILIDNIHEFDDTGAYSGGFQLLDQLVKAYKAAEGSIPFIITGSEAEVNELLNKKKNLRELFNLPKIILDGYTVDELVEIAYRMAEDKELVISEDAISVLRSKLEHMAGQPDFMYSQDLDRLINNAYINQVNRISGKRRPSENDYYLILAEDFGEPEEAETVEELLAELDRMTGLAEVKAQVRRIVNHVQVQKLQKSFNIAQSEGHGTLHLVFTGNAGTGKTTVARIIGKIYKRLGVLPSGQLVECTRRDLVSQYVGATAPLVQQKVKEAMGGILFIDEAYTLCRDDNDTFGKEAIEALLTDIENHRDSLMVILAGYSREMEKFMDQNQGLRSRIPTNIHFEDYTDEEMIEIFRQNIKKAGKMLDTGLEKTVEELIGNESRKRDFGNARGVRNITNAVILNMENRIGETDFSTLSKNDFLIIKKEDLKLTDEKAEYEKTVEELLDELDRMTGLAEVKAQVHRIVNHVQVQKLQKSFDIAQSEGHGTLHLVFTGNAGTGKTTVARIIGNIYKRLGVLSSGQLVECTRRDLVAQYVGATAPLVQQKVREAMGGILFIDEAYTLCRDDNDTFGKEAIEALLTDIENHRDSLMVILAGYSKEMERFMDQNQGLRSRIPTNIHFADYTVEEMIEIFHQNIKKAGKTLDAGLENDVAELIRSESGKKDFGNARGIRNITNAVILNMENRIGETDFSTLSKNDFLVIKKADLKLSEEKTEKTKTVEEYLDELYSLTGLASVKEKVKRIIATVKANKDREARGMTSNGFGTLHMVFKGNAGTGKTTVARIIGSIYRELGVLEKGQLIECGRSDLVAPFLGQTAPKTKAKIQEALGGILFIDEAYSLASDPQDSFGKEAIDTLVADIENYRSQLMVIIAGYSDDMDVFLSKNQGLRSRFPNEIIFEDYSVDEMLSIFEGMLASMGLTAESDTLPLIRSLIEQESQKADFGNARGIRNITQKIAENQNFRLYNESLSGKELTESDYRIITKEDLLNIN